MRGEPAANGRSRALRLSQSEPAARPLTNERHERAGTAAHQSETGGGPELSQTNERHDGPELLLTNERPGAGQSGGRGEEVVGVRPVAIGVGFGLGIGVRDVGLG